MWAHLYAPQTRIARHAKWYVIAPAALIIIGIALMISGIWAKHTGMNLGLDFTGGSVIEATGLLTQPEQQTAYDTANAYLKSKGVTFDITKSTSNTSDYGLSIKYQGENESISNGLVAALNALSSDGKVTSIKVKPTETISASASGERIMITFISIAVTLIAILVYILFRFKFTSGVAAVVGLLHDVFVVVALCVIFRVQINYSFVAAIITLVVYSLNNTIVLFDRIRGKEKLLKITGSKQTTEQIVDASIKETFARTLGTTITTLVPVLVLCFLPVPLIREFAWPIFFGLIAGSFSTIFVTTSLYIRFEKFTAYRRRMKEKEKFTRAENLV